MLLAHKSCPHFCFLFLLALQRSLLHPYATLSLIRFGTQKWHKNKPLTHCFTDRHRRTSNCNLAGNAATSLTNHLPTARSKIAREDKSCSSEACACMQAVKALNTAVGPQGSPVIDALIASGCKSGPQVTRPDPPPLHFCIFSTCLTHSGTCMELCRRLCVCRLPGG